jgi:hypothetical protein
VQVVVGENTQQRQAGIPTWAKNGKRMGIGGKYDYNFKYYNGFYGPRQDGEASHDYSGYIFGPSRGSKKWDEMLDPLSSPLRPKAKFGTQGTGEKKFWGVDFGGSIKVILGVEYKLKVGILY